MTKPNDCRIRGSAEDKKSSQNPHLYDEQQLLALDGELSSQETAQVLVHLEACWSCRVRREQIETAIRDVVEYRDHLIQPQFPMSPGGRSKFISRLDQLAANIGRPPLWKQVLKALRVFGAISQIELPRYIWIGGLVIAALVLFSVTRLWQVPKVSASELLDNAQGSEVRALKSVSMPVVYQKLSIRVGSQTVTRTSYRDPVGNRQMDRLDVAEGAAHKLAGNVGRSRRPVDQPTIEQAEEAELRRTFLTAHLSWQDPLSPANYRAWFKSLDEKRDEVTAIGDGYTTLKTTTSEGPIAQASITIRDSDFHPVAEDLWLQDSRHVEVHELAWQILPMEAINVAIFEPEPTLFPVIKHPGIVSLEPPVVTDSELAEAELRARVALHAEKADLGEQIDFDSDLPTVGHRSVVVQGVVGTPERRNDLIAALQGIPHIEVHLQTTEEAQLRQDQVGTDRSQDVAPQIAQGSPTQDYGVTNDRTELPPILVSGGPAYERQLEERFPVSEDRIAFVNKIVEDVEDGMAQAWALRRLTNRYTPDAVGELSRESQHTLELLLRDNVSVLHHEIDEIQIRVSPLLPPTSMAMPQPVSDASAENGDWRATVMSVFSEMQKVNDNGGALFAAPGKALPDPEIVVRELQQALFELGIQVAVLDQQVSGPFLSEPRSDGR